MNSLIIVCVIVTSHGWMSFETNIYKSPDVAKCHDFSWDHGGKGMVASWDTFELPRDKKSFEIKCGNEGIDCRSVE